MEMVKWLKIFSLIQCECLPMHNTMELFFLFLSVTYILKVFTGNIQELSVSKKDSSFLDITVN
jgi:hypothetical protein